MAALLDAHYRQVAKAIMDGRLVPLLGAGVNLCGRPADTPWQRGRYLPSGTELAGYLADYFDYPDDEHSELVRVSEYVSVTTGAGPLYEELHKLFDADYPATALHRLLAAIPATLRSGGLSRCPLILTTNYDDALERAFDALGEPYDVIVYIAEGEFSGKFIHYSPDSRRRLIDRPNKYVALTEDRPVILKIHGAVDRVDSDRDSYVITEDHYIDYLTRTELGNLVPASLLARLKRSHFLFLGYSMRDWNLRVILRRIWGQQTLSYKSWAVQLHPDEIEQEFWRKRGVDILDIRLEEYVAGLTEHLDRLCATPAATP